METIKKVINSKPYLKCVLRPFYRMAKKLYSIVKKNACTSSDHVFLSNKKVIYFDITSHSVSEVKTGIQRVVAKFLEYLHEVAGEDYEIICISGLNQYHIIEKDTFQPRYDLMIAPKAGDIYLSIDFNPVQPYEYWSTLESWQRNGCKLIACVYDLVYIKYPEYVADENAVRLLSRWLKLATSNFDGLVCISKTVERELLQWMNENNIKNNRLKTGYFHLGGDFVKPVAKTKDSTEAFFECICKKKPLTFLAVATIEPRKGYLDLLEAFERLIKAGTDVMLIIVGRIGWKYEEIVEKITSSECYNRSVFWLSDCEDNVLEIFYQIADCYLSGSYYEGFGLGIIEASNKGLPVILRDIPVNREVSEEKGLYYKSVKDLEGIIKNVSDNPKILLEQDSITSLSWKESVTMAWKAIQTMM